MTLFSIVRSTSAANSERAEARTRVVASRMRPASSLEWDHDVVRFDESTFALVVAPPSGTSRLTQRGLLLGHCIEGDPETESGDALDGTFLVVRVEADEVRVQTDATASFSAWVSNCPDGGFVASNSQRLAIGALDSFDLDPQSLTWLLSTGYQGSPQGSWDRRLRVLAPDTLCVARRGTRLLSYSSSRGEPGGDLFAAIERSISAHQHVLSRSVIALSGGLDSLALATALSGRSNGTTRLSTVTWGSPGAEQRRGSDAYVANAASTRLKSNHDFLEISPKSPEHFLREFAQRSEGRVDHVAGYTDSFETWSRVRSLNKEFVLRGDEGFGWLPTWTARDVRIATRIQTFRDQGLPPEGKLGLPRMEFAPGLRRGRQSLSGWRDTIYRQWDLPRVLAALSTTKAAFVETLNPFLTRRVLNAVRALADRDRTNKSKFRRWASRLAVEEVATTNGTSRPLESAESGTFLWETLRRERLPADLVRFLRAPAAPRLMSAQAPLWKRSLKRHTPPLIRSVARNLRPGTYSSTRLLWRSWLAAETIWLMEADATAVAAV